MKRVLIFSLTYHPFVGGAEVAIKEITNRIDPNAYTFDMITLRFDSKLPRVEKAGNITIYRIGMSVDSPRVSDRHLPWQLKLSKIFFPLTSFFKAIALDRVHSYDLVWSMMANYAAFGALLFKYTHPRTPYFLELQDGNSLAQVKTRQPILRAVWPLYRCVYSKASVIKAISKFIESTARDTGYHGIIHVIPNGVDTERFSAAVSDETLQALKAKYGKRMGDVFLFTASRLVLSRGVEDVIQSLKYLPSNVKLLIAGDGDARETLETIARDTGVAERVLWAGHVDHAQLPALLKISDIFVRPSIIEGFGNAFVEAFAAGIPVVATPVGGIPDFLFDPVRNPEHPPTGIFCNVHDPESVARAVERYLNDPALVAQVVKNARDLAREKYDWNTIADMQRKLVFEPLTKGY